MSQFFEEDPGNGVRLVSVHGDLDLLVVEEFVAVARAAVGSGPTVELDLGGPTDHPVRESSPPPLYLRM